MFVFYGVVVWDSLPWDKIFGARVGVALSPFGITGTFGDDDVMETEGTISKRPGAEMNDLQGMQMQNKMNDRQGSLFWLLVLSVGLVGVAVALSVMRREEAEPFVLLLLAFFSVVGVLSLFASAVGFLRISEQGRFSPLLSVITESLGEGLVVTASDHRVIYSNDAYRVLSGADLHSVPPTVQRAFAANPEANDSTYRLFQAAINGSQWQEEFRVVIAGDEERVCWYRICVQPIMMSLPVLRKDKACTLWRVVDITSECSKQEDTFQELQRAIDYLDHAPAGFFSTGGNGRIDYMNATLAGWLGLDLTQTVSGELAISDIVVGDTEALLSRAIPVPGKICTEILDLDLRRCDGTFLPVRLLHGVSFAADGSHGYSRTLVINRSQGEDVSEDLRAAEVRFARFFNNAPISIATVDNEGRIVRANSNFAKTQAECNSRLGSHPLLSQLLDNESHETVQDALREAGLGKGDISPVDVTLVGKSNRSARLFVSPVHNTEANREIALVYAVDTTVQRALEMQFAQSQKMQAVGQLAGGVAHDFNNVLTAIIGYSDLLLSSHRATDPAFQDIMNIKQSANRAACLVRQLLAFSRRQTLQPEVLKLNDVISDLTAILARLLNEKVELEVFPDRSLWLVKADMTQFEQVIMNLVVNARDAMPDGGKLTINTSNVSMQDVEDLGYQAMPVSDYVRIEVTDTGQGMSPEVTEKVFEPFFSTKEVGKGTGLGLSMVYGIVKQTGGFIFPKSELGKGTTFLIFLPRHITSGVVEDIKVPDTRFVASDTTGNGVILLVEDEDAVRAFASRALSSRGYTVLEASTGVEALEVFNKHEGKVDLVVSDVVMPEMDGPTLLKKLRQKIPDIKIIFISGYAEDAFQKNLEDDACFTLLQKPFNLKDLASTVKRVLEGI
ncbi:MAG: response regulator [Alphaproteobacteria bacterium]|nr:response regulator [Alphaproteobacteria bacterium]